MTVRLLLALACIPAWLPAIDGPSGDDAAADPGKPENLVDTLDQAALQEAFRLLTRDYINHESLDSLEVNRAALQGMLELLDVGARLLTEKARRSRNSPFGFYHTRIDEDTAYVRFGQYRNEEVQQLDAALEKYSDDEKLRHLILDLRSPQPQAKFSVASRILGRFQPPNELLFKIRRPGNDRPSLFVSEAAPSGWTRNLILLVDRETGNVGEIIAAVLERETDCLIIGEKTPGLTVEYRDVPIGEDRILRYAIAEVVLEDGSSLFREGITPDIVTPTASGTKRKIFRATEKEDKPLTDYLFLEQRPRMNEAALVAGTDPEIDYHLMRSQGKTTKWDDPTPQDRALRQAVDLLNTATFLESEPE